MKKKTMNNFWTQHFKCYECGTQDSFDSRSAVPDTCPNCGEEWIKVDSLDKEDLEFEGYE